MIRRALVVLLLLTAVPAHAGFDEVLGELEGKLGHTMWIPLFGMVRTFVRIGHPSGVHDVQLAVFEGKGRLDPVELERMMQSRAGREYVPLVRVRSRRENESSFIYMRPINDKMDLLVLTNDGEDTVLVRVVVNPDVVAQYINKDPRNVGQLAKR